MHKRHILLVEDDPDHEALTVRALKKARVLNEILVARDGAQALDMLFGRNGSSEPPLPALVLLDLKLPYVRVDRTLTEESGGPSALEGREQMPAAAHSGLMTTRRRGSSPSETVATPGSSAMTSWTTVPGGWVTTLCWS